MKFKIVYKSIGGADNLGNRIQFNNYTLREAVNLWCNNQEQARTKYGDINEWDVSQVNDMSQLFSEKNNFNSNIANWDTSNVTSMTMMFSEAILFNQDISNWNTSNVTNMERMFVRARVFNNGATNNYPNHPLLTNGNAWNTSSVTNMMGMFSEASSFNQDISNWNTSRVTDMEKMFLDASSFNNGATNDDPNYPLLTNGDAWNTSSVTNMKGMFFGATSFNQPIGNWDVSNVTNMQYMFFGARVFDQNIGNWDVSSVTNMRNMFRAATAFNQHIGYWIIDHNCNIQNMFLDSGVTRETFEGRVYGQRIADSFDPPLPNPRTNEELEIYRARRRIQDRSRLAIVANTLSEDYIIDDSGNQISFRPIPEIINGEINIDFPVISDREQLRTRLNEINNVNRQFNLNNIYIDDNGREFVLFIIVDGNRYPLFKFDENNNLIVKKPYNYLDNYLMTSSPH